jgi:glycosyltransferase involved in cell wall biosynthesis
VRVESRHRVVQLLATGNVGGAQVSATELMLRLERSRFDVEAISLTEGPALDRMRELQLPVTVLDETDDSAAVRALASHLRDREVDLLHAHMFRAELLGARAARLAGTPAVVATVHSSRVRSPADIAALAAETPLIDHLIAPSEAIAAKLGREGRGSVRISVIPNGVDLHRFGQPRSAEERTAIRASLGIPADAFAVGAVARLEPEKGHRYLLAAWPEIAEAVPGAWLLLIGSGSMTDALRAQTLSLAPPACRRVAFVGEQTDVVALTQSLDLAVLPSLREAQGIALLEAMAARVPVVASRVGGIPETIRDGVDGLLVPPADSDALAGAIVRVARNVGLRDRLAVAGRRRVEDRFSVDDAVRRVAATYLAELSRAQLDRADGSTVAHG